MKIVFFNVFIFLNHRFVRFYKWASAKEALLAQRQQLVYGDAIKGNVEFDDLPRVRGGFPSDFGRVERFCKVYEYDAREDRRVDGVPLRAELKRTLVCRGKWEGFHLQHYFEFNKRLAQYEELRKGNGETQEHFVYATFAYCCAKLEWAAEQGVDVLVPVGKALMTALANGVLMEHNKGEATDGNPEEAAKAAFRRSRSLVGFVDISRRRYKIPLEGITESMLDIVMQLDGGWEQSWAKSQVVPLEIMLTLNKRNLGYLLLRYKKSPSSGGALCFRGLRVNSKWRKLNIGKLLIRVWLRLCRRYNFTAETELMNKPVICLLLRHHFGFAPDRLHSPVEVACSGPGETNDKVRIWANDYSRLKGLYSNSFLKSQNIEIMKDKPGTSRTIYVKTRYRRADNSFAEKETTAIAFYASRLYRFVDTVLTHCS